MTKQEIIEELSQLSVRFDSALGKLDSATSQTDVESVSTIYSELKTYVVEYSKKLEKLQHSGRLNELQSTILLPAISEVASHCSAPKNSTNKADLGSCLYDGADYLSYYLGQLHA